MAYTLGQYNRDVASGKIKNPDVWTYKNVIDWQAKTRAGRAKTRKANPLVSQATAITDSVINPAVAALMGSKAGVTQEANRLAQQEMEAAKGIAMALRPYSKDIQNIYTTAGNALSGAAQGFSTEVGGMLDADTNKNNMTLAALGLDPQATKMGGTVTDVLYGQTYPAARGMISSGRDYAAAAAMRPGTAILQGQQYAAARRQAGQEGLSKIDEEIAKLQGSRGQTYFDAMKYVSGERDSAFDRKMAAEKLVLDKQDMILKGQAMEASMRELGLKEEADKWARYVDQTRLELEAARIQASAASSGPDPKVITGKNGSIVQVNPDGSVVQLAPPGTLGTQSTAKPKGMSPTQTASLAEKATEDIQVFRFGTTTDADGKEIPGTAERPGDNRITYQEAFKRLRTRYKRLGNRAILNLLNEAWDEPGTMDVVDGGFVPSKGGRPYFDMFERAKLKKAGFTAAQIRNAMRPENRGWTPVGSGVFAEGGTPSKDVLRMLRVLGRNDTFVSASPETGTTKLTFEQAVALKKAGYTEDQIAAIVSGALPLPEALKG